jgi:4-hydroxyproline epimerase
VEGAPDFGERSMAERLERFRREHDEFRSAVVNEPRCSWSPSTGQPRRA